MASHQVTALVAQKRNPNRVNIYLDGEFAFGLARIVAAWLYIGQELSDEKVTQLRLDDEREVAFQRSLKLLNYRPRTRAELRTDLSSHEISEMVVDETLSRLSELGLVDDAKFAQDWIENRSEFRPRGRRALVFELRRHGLESETIEQSLAELPEDELALQAARKQSRKLAGLDQQAFRQKMIAYLSRRGFNYETSAGATAQVWTERQTAEIINGEVE